VAPYCDVADLDVEVADALSEEDGTPDSVRTLVHDLLQTKESAALCTHRPLLPWVFDALGVEEQELEPGAMVVVHHRRGRVVAVEHHNVAFR
jgi:8-oxo-dGTP diphosphatase